MTQIKIFDSIIQAPALIPAPQVVASVDVQTSFSNLNVSKSSSESVMPVEVPPM